MENKQEKIYPVCTQLLAKCSPPRSLTTTFPAAIEEDLAVVEVYPFLMDLAAVEAAQYRVAEMPSPAAEAATMMVNPTLELLVVNYHGLPEFIQDPATTPVKDEGFVAVYRPTGGDQVVTMMPQSHDLLALKITCEGLDLPALAEAEGVTIGVLEGALSHAVRSGLLIKPASTLTRGPGFPQGEVTDPEMFTAQIFTLQWHVTQACDLHCRHCYDRTDRKEMTLAEGIAILDDVYDFCKAHHVRCQITFTGGNPLLHPHFLALYQAAVDRGFQTAILGNPMPKHRIEEILAIQRLAFYQVSLEGLAEHNDYIRGEGHYKRTFAFLDLLRELDVYSMVMLTLTRANMDQVLPLAEALRDRVDLFTYNRLAMVGEGAALASVDPAVYPEFVEQYVAAARHNPCMAYKDNFINLHLHDNKMPLFDGCAVFGCGAAFNFVSLLPDGEVHACRKFPSPIGNIYERSLSEIYHDQQAARYRAGSKSCEECPIRPACGGCPAVSHGFGLDVFEERDPYCFVDKTKILPMAN